LARESYHEGIRLRKIREPIMDTFNQERIMWRPVLMATNVAMFKAIP